MKASCRISDIEKVVMNASAFDESALAIGDEAIHEWLQAQGQHLGNNFRYGVYETDWAVIRDAFRPSFFRMRIIFAFFSKLKYAHLRSWKALMASTTSCLMIGQHVLKNNPV